MLKIICTSLSIITIIQFIFTGSVYAQELPPIGTCFEDPDFLIDKSVEVYGKATDGERNLYFVDIAETDDFLLLYLLSFETQPKSCEVLRGPDEFSAVSSFIDFDVAVDLYTQYYSKRISQTPGGVAEYQRRLDVLADTPLDPEELVSLAEEEIQALEDLGFDLKGGFSIVYSDPNIQNLNEVFSSPHSQPFGLKTIRIIRALDEYAIANWFKDDIQGQSIAQKIDDLWMVIDSSEEGFDAEDISFRHQIPLNIAERLVESAEE